MAGLMHFFPEGVLLEMTTCTTTATIVAAAII